MKARNAIGRLNSRATKQSATSKQLLDAKVKHVASSIPLSAGQRCPAAIRR
jgi:hypothetical protein